MVQLSVFSLETYIAGTDTAQFCVDLGSGFLGVCVSRARDCSLAFIHRAVCERHMLLHCVVTILMSDDQPSP